MNRAAQSLELAAYPADLLQLGLWGPDFFSAFYYVLLSEALEDLERDRRLALIPGLTRALDSARRDDASRALIRRHAIFLHFDNLGGELDSNEEIHLLWNRLFDNTRDLLLATRGPGGLDPNERAIVVLLALGSSLHMVQDFYSHSNWTHLDFSTLGFDGFEGGRVPTYFEALAAARRGGRPGELPFAIELGIYPDLGAGAWSGEGPPRDHAHMHHDSSALETGGRSMAEFHEAGPRPATRSATRHQAVAVATATAASSEWLERLGADPEIEQILREAARAREPALLLGGTARSAVEAMVRVSFLVGTWDGRNPGEREREVERQVSLTAAKVLLKLLRGSRELLPNPFNRYWSLYVDWNIPGRLVRGFADPRTGRYSLRRRTPQPILATAPDVAGTAAAIEESR